MIEKLQRFWALVVEVWQNGVFGTDLGRVLIAVLVFAAFLLIRRLFARFVIASLKRAAKRSKTDLDDLVLEAVDKPLRFIPVILGLFFAAEYLTLSEDLQIFASNLLRSLIAFNIFWVFYAAIGPLGEAFKQLKDVFGESLVEWLVKLLKAIVFFIGAAAILELWGIKVGPLLAGLGLFGVAVALGAQDLFKNLIAGVLIMAERRFENGDWVLVEGIVEGTVESIGFRSTLIRRFDKAPVYVPNAKMSDNAVTNFTEMTHRRIYWHLGVEYRTTVDQLREIRNGIETYILEQEEFASPSEVSTFVRIDRFSDSSIDIMVYCFTKTTNWGEWLEIKERLAYRIKEIVEGAGTGFAFPSQSLYVESLPADRPEIFVPPTDQTSKRV